MGKGEEKERREGRGKKRRGGEKETQEGEEYK